MPKVSYPNQLYMTDALFALQMYHDDLLLDGVIQGGYAHQAEGWLNDLRGYVLIDFSLEKIYSEGCSHFLDLAEEIIEKLTVGTLLYVTFAKHLNDAASAAKLAAMRPPIRKARNVLITLRRAHTKKETE